MTYNSNATKFKFYFVMFFSVFLFGCNSSSNTLAPANVSGSVTYKGTALTGGSVQFVTSTGTPYSAPIAIDGTYSLADLPIGEMAVVVETESVNPIHKQSSSHKDAAKYNAMSDQRKGPNGQSAPTSTGNEPKYVKIPDKYMKQKTTPLTFTIKSGRQVYNIVLE